MIRLAIILVALTVAIPAFASNSCPTEGEARAAHPGEHLWWHGRAHCWDTTPGRRHEREHWRVIERHHYTAAELAPAPEPAPFTLAPPGLIERRWPAEDDTPLIVDEDEYNLLDMALDLADALNGRD